MNEEPGPENILFTIGPYPILKKIGEGGMGEVFLGYDPQTQRRIALKRIRSDIPLTQAHRERFLNEARTTKLLAHPAIIPILSIVEDQDPVYYTMPFIEGLTLKGILEEACKRAKERTAPDSSSSVATFCSFFIQICEAVAYAHSKGLIHRDLKPSNIIVDKNGLAHLLDWGLVTDMSIEKVEESMPGTLLYFAPELMSGAPRSCQTEIYSLGLILYEMLTLRYPFHRATLEFFVRNWDREALIDPAKAAPFRHIPPFLSKIALKCLALSPADRYQSVNEILHDLRKGLQESKRALSESQEMPAPKSGQKASNPLSSAGQKRLLQRLEKAAKGPRNTFLTLALLAARLVPLDAYTVETRKIMNGLADAMLPHFFVDREEYMTWPTERQQQTLAVHLAFLLRKPHQLAKVFDAACAAALSPLPLLMQILTSLIKCGEWGMAQDKLDEINLQFLDIQAIAQLEWMQEALTVCRSGVLSDQFVSELPKRVTRQQLLPVLLILEEALRLKALNFIAAIVDALIMKHDLDDDQLWKLDSFLIAAYQLKEEWSKAEELLQWYIRKDFK